MPKTTTLDEALTLLSVLGEEDSIGFEHDQQFQSAIGTVAAKIEAKVQSGELARDRVVLTDITE